MIRIVFDGFSVMRFCFIFCCVARAFWWIVH
jgi:hypothetical protein